MKSTLILIRLGLLAVMISALAGCGGSDGAPGAAGAPGTPGTSGGNVTQAVNMTADQWAAAQLSVSDIKVTINSAPVVTFKVTDDKGNPVTGLATKGATNTTTNTANLNNMFFTLAKLVPSVNNNPSVWRSYLVTKPSAATATGAVTIDGKSMIGGFPQRELEGNLVDNGDGTYQYTFYRDITKAAAYVAGMTPAGLNDPADLGDVSYQPTLTHRLGIVINGKQPGGTVTMALPTNATFDFVPNGAAVTTTRNIVQRSSCDGCHSGKVIGHNDRRDPQLCVTCHTDQAKYGFPEAKTTATGYADTDSNGYKRVNGEAAFTYPRMIHQTHMGDELIKTGYNLNAHAKKSDGTYGCDSTSSNKGQCFNMVGFPKSPADCTTCHDGSDTKSDGSVNANKTADGDNWKNNPSIIACGACHDGIDFATGTGITLADRDADAAAGYTAGTTKTGHGGGAQSNNTNCTACHLPGTIINGSNLTDIVVAHRLTVPTLNNPVVKANIDTLAYIIKSVTVNAAGNPVVTFQIRVNGTTVTQLNQIPLVTNGTTGAQVADQTISPMPQFPELLDPVSSANRDGTIVGGMSETMNGLGFVVAFAVPQGGIAVPADYNVETSVSLTNLLVAPGSSPSAGSLSNTLSSGVYQADSSGYFTATITGDTVGQAVGTGCAVTAPTVATCVNKAVPASPILVPANAAMATVAMIGGFTQTTNLPAPIPAYTQFIINANPVVSDTGGLHVTAQLVKVNASICSQSGATSACTTPRRVIVSAANCNNCHERLGTSPNFHAGDRNDPTACNLCHNGNRVDSGGWTADSSTWLHGIHGASKRTVAFTPTSSDFSQILYPGVLTNCQQCHLPNTMNFSATGGDALQPNLLWSTTASGTMAAGKTAVSPITGLPTTNSSQSPYVTSGTVYGSVFSYTIATGVSTAAAGTTLVNSPIASACFSCHDTGSAKNHMESNGGAIYETLASQSDGAGNLVNREACLTCHGAGKIMDTAVVHQ